MNMQQKTETVAAAYLFLTAGFVLYFSSYLADWGVFFLLHCTDWDSPFYLSEPLGEPFAGHLFYELVQFVSGHGGARGGAFPSAHVSGAVIVWAVAWQRQRRLALIVTPVIAGLIMETVYGRFHYALDTFAGFALGVSIVAGYRITRSSSSEKLP